MSFFPKTDDTILIKNHFQSHLVCFSSFKVHGKSFKGRAGAMRTSDGSFTLLLLLYKIFVFKSMYSAIREALLAFSFLYISLSGNMNAFKHHNKRFEVSQFFFYNINITQQIFTIYFSQYKYVLYFLYIFLGVVCLISVMAVYIWRWYYLSIHTSTRCYVLER